MPDAAVHGYHIQGKVDMYPTHTGGKFVGPYEEYWLDGNARWEQNQTEATELFLLSGSLTGKLMTVFRCQKDPWLYHDTSCVFINASYIPQSGKTYDWPSILKVRGRPLSIGAVSLAQATALSKQSSKAPPPPPPSSKGQQPPGQSPITGGFATPTTPPFQISKSAAQPDRAKAAGAHVLAPGVDLTGNVWVKINSGAVNVKWGDAVTLSSMQALDKGNGKCRFKLEYMIRNLGPNPSGPYTIQWFDGNRAMLASHSLGSLVAKSTTVPTTLIELAPGRHNLSLVIDSLNQVAESNEANNRLSFSADVDQQCGKQRAAAPPPPSRAPVGRGPGTPSAPVRRE